MGHGRNMSPNSNRKELEAMLRWSFEQGLAPGKERSRKSSRRVSPRPGGTPVIPRELKVRASADAPHGLGRGCRQQVHDLIGGEHVGEADEQCVQRGIVRFVRHCGVGIGDD